MVGKPARRFTGICVSPPKLADESFCYSPHAGLCVKVTPEQQDIIRRMHGDGTKTAAIARTLILSRPTVYSILSG